MTECHLINENIFLGRIRRPRYELTVYIPYVGIIKIYQMASKTFHDILKRSYSHGVISAICLTCNLSWGRHNDGRCKDGHVCA